MREEEVISSIPFSEHLSQFRQAIIQSLVCLGCFFLLSFIFCKKLLLFFLAPFKTPLIFLGPFEGLFITFKVAFICSLLFSSPFIVFVLLRFLLPGLKTNERKVIFTLLFGVLFACGGALLGYFFSLPFMIQFFSKYNEGIAQNFWRVNEALNAAFWILVSHAIAFELIAFLWGLMLFGLVTHRTLKKARPWVILSIFILAAILTPPDVISQVCLAIPLYLLFEASLFVNFLARKG